MKKLFDFAIGIVCCLFISCNQNPVETEVTLMNSYESIQEYFPYTLDNSMVFMNTSNGELWEVNPNDRFKDGIFPEFQLRDVNPGSKTPTSWSCSGSAEFWVDKNKSQAGMLRIYNAIAGLDESMGTVLWTTAVQLNDHSELLDGSWSWHGSIDEMLHIITDTIIIPVGYTYSILYNDTIMESIKKPEDETLRNAYARIVKGQGMTDFSLDGTTIWKRVK